MNHHFAGTFIKPGKERSHHATARPGGDRLGDVAAVADAAIGDHRHAGGFGNGNRIENGRNLRHADAADNSRRADRARADADFHAIDAGIDQIAGGFGGGDVAGDHLDIVALL